ncbi:MAG: hypothetical protein WA113_05195 [Desulfitobacteriaceae bacterium]
MGHIVDYQKEAKTAARELFGMAIQGFTEIPETMEPSDEELRILRTIVDPVGILRNEEPVG